MDEMIQNVQNADKNNAKKELTEEEKKKLYDKTKKLMKSTACIQQYELYMYIYKLIVRRLRKLKGYLDADELLKEYKSLLKKTEKEGKEKIYQNMLDLKEQVKNPEDIEWLRKEVARISGYKDADEVDSWCEVRLKEMEKTQQRRSIFHAIIFLIVIVVAVVVVKMFIMP